ncbi:MAG TPA: transcription termination/antitermination protein NusG [Candidatus Binatia bacterium]|jgi:transcriptional antiterminator NusG
MQKHWYAVCAFPGYEHRVKAALTRKISAEKMQDTFGDIVVPTEKIIELVRGEKRIVERRMFPGYLLVCVDLTAQAWHLIRSVPKVIGLVGRDQTPTPLADTEVESILNRIGAAAVKPRPKTIFAVGDRVKIVDGPFREFTGTVEEFKPERSHLKVALSVFGRPTPVVIDPLHVEAA